MWDHCRTLSDTKQRQIKHKIIQDNILVIYKSTCMQFIFISQNILYVTLISRTHGLYLGSFDKRLSWVLKSLNTIWAWKTVNCIDVIRDHGRGGPERMGPRPPPWVPLLKSYGSSILSTSLGSKTLNNTSSLGLGGTKI